jgi:hypothetical protein
MIRDLRTARVTRHGNGFVRKRWVHGYGATRKFAQRNPAKGQHNNKLSHEYQRKNLLRHYPRH